ncbi:PUA-like domain-containing protein [Crepidotus variabilis]|uniref:PUA-like domain-containing protein n=1 Tax=Crepidotus variabilis TaxID=179855 RepID=A0A9P6JSD5_9AGAR|nr:PUA-like domain-containing protein [Crepidotus variabilis]
MRIEDRRKVLLQDPQKFPPDMRGESKYGPVHGVELFKVFATKQEASDARIHRAPRAGIAGSSLVKGAQSIALSGRYEDDIDNGDIIFYTGTGGQEVLSARDKARGRIPRQEVPQTFANQLNAALRVNKELGTPVRVLRGANKHSPYAPSEGYRYDGCYLVQTAEIAVGRSGFNICRYKLTVRRVFFRVYPSSLTLTAPD